MEPTNVIMDKSLRSVFVGNIPYEATEEKLKDIFCQAGSVGMYGQEDCARLLTRLPLSSFVQACV